MCSGSVAGSSGKGCSWRQDRPGSWGGFGDLFRIAAAAGKPWEKWSKNVLIIYAREGGPQEPTGTGKAAAAGGEPRPGVLEAFGDLSGQRQRLREAPEGRSSGKAAEICSGPRQRAPEARRTWSQGKAGEISEDPAGSPGRHPGGGKAAEAGSSGKTAEYKTQ